jgi:hypothetical protein
MARDVGIDASEETVRNDLSNVETPVLGCRATRRREGRDLMAQVTQVEEERPVGFWSEWVPMLEVTGLTCYARSISRTKRQEAGSRRLGSGRLGPGSAGRVVLAGRDAVRKASRDGDDKTSVCWNNDIEGEKTKARN